MSFDRRGLVLKGENNDMRPVLVLLPLAILMLVAVACGDGGPSYTGGSSGCSTFERLRRDLVGGDVRDFEVRDRLKAIQVATSGAEPSISTAAANMLRASVDVDSLHGPFEDMTEACAAHEYLP